MNTVNRFSGKKVVRLLGMLIFVGSLLSVVMLVVITSLLKHDQMTTRMMKRSVSSSSIIIEFMEPVTTVLNTMYSWGRSGRLSLDNTEDLSRLIVPLLDNKPMTRIAGVSIADTTGRSLFLYRDNDHWFVKVTEKGESTISELHTNDGSLKEVRTVRDGYDPRNRAWFSTVASDSGSTGEIRWSGPYRFYTKQKTGITASVKVSGPDGDDDYRVIGCDFLLAELKSAISSIIPDTGESRVFLMTDSGYVSDLTPLVHHDVDDLIDRQRGLSGDDIPGTIRESFMAEMVNAEETGHTVFSFKNDTRNWWGSISPTPPETGLAHLCIAIPESVLTADIKPVKYTLFILSFSVLAVASLVLTWVAGKYGRRLDAMTGSLAGYVAATDDEILALIRTGESETVEFKSTLRWNLKTEKNGKEIELASLKTIVAFMNSGGGTLLVGVSDDGSVSGIGPDHFENDDKALLHFNGLFAQHIGLGFAEYISFDIREISGGKILVVDSRRADQPVFLKTKAGEEFYVRVGPGSRKLSTSEVIDYLKHRQVKHLK